MVSHDDDPGIKYGLSREERGCGCWGGGGSCPGGLPRSQFRKTMLRSMILVMLLLFTPQLLIADAQEFSMEERFGVQSAIPQEALRYITAKVGKEFETYGCLESNLSEVLEATTVQLSPRGTTALIVKPFAVCACAVRSCTFWIFLPCSHGYCPAGEIDAGILTVNKDKTKNGFYQLETYAGTAGWSNEAVYTYNKKRKKYVEVKRWSHIF
jgi:hypothetical protein